MVQSFQPVILQLLTLECCLRAWVLVDGEDLGALREGGVSGLGLGVGLVGGRGDALLSCL